MGKFTKDKRVLKTFLYSKKVTNNFSNIQLFRISIIEKLRKMVIGQDRLINYFN
jgi:hypothetical protein